MSVGMSGLLCYTMVMPELPDLEVSKEKISGNSCNSWQKAFWFWLVQVRRSKMKKLGLLLAVVMLLGACASSAPEATPTPTSIPVPTNTPMLPAPGIGVSRADIQSVFESEKFGFRFEAVRDRDGQPTVWGYRLDWTSCDLILVGPPEELVEVFIIIGLHKDDPAKGILNCIRMGTLLKLVAPDWENGDDWLTDNMPIARTGGRVETFHGDLRIQLECVQLGMVTLSIEGRGN